MRSNHGLISLVTALALVAVSAVLGLAHLTGGSAASTSAAAAPTASGVPSAVSLLPPLPTSAGSTPPSGIRNIVLVLADDLDWSLWNAVPRLRNLETQGTTLTNDVVSDSVDAVRASLAASRHTDDTLVIVTSDNGLPVGSDRTHRGKRSAFDADTVVPMVAIGPGVPAGQVISRTPPGRPGPRGVLACCPKASA